MTEATHDKRKDLQFFCLRILPYFSITLNVKWYLSLFRLLAYSLPDCKLDFILITLAYLDKIFKNFADLYVSLWYRENKTDLNHMFLILVIHIPNKPVTA